MFLQLVQARVTAVKMVSFQHPAMGSGTRQRLQPLDQREWGNNGVRVLASELRFGASGGNVEAMQTGDVGVNGNNFVGYYNLLPSLARRITMLPD